MKCCSISTDHKITRSVIVEQAVSELQKGHMLATARTLVGTGPVFVGESRCSLPLGSPKISMLAFLRTCRIYSCSTYQPRVCSIPGYIWQWLSSVYNSNSQFSFSFSLLFSIGKERAIPLQITHHCQGLKKAGSAISTEHWLLLQPEFKS